MATILDHFKAHLISQGLVRDPNTAGSLPPVWRDPEKGVPEPGEGNGVQIGTDAVVGLMHAGGFPAAPYESEWRQERVDVVIRAVKSPVGYELGGEVRRVTVDRRNWMMGGITVLQSDEFAPLQPVRPQTQGYMFIWGVLFQIRAEDAY